MYLSPGAASKRRAISSGLKTHRQLARLADKLVVVHDLALMMSMARRLTLGGRGRLLLGRTELASGAMELSAGVNLRTRVSD
jgi:hypothetical protein